MIYVTGDTHGEFRRLIDFCDKVQPTKDDIMIILGDAGINYSGNPKDGWKKQLLAKLPSKYFASMEITRNVLKQFQAIKQLHGMVEPYGMSSNIQTFILLRMEKYMILTEENV